VEFKGFHETPFFTSNRLLTSLDKLPKMLGKLKSVYYQTIRFYNKTVTVTSLYWKLCYTALIVISTSKIIIVFFFCKLIQMMLEAFYRFNITGEWIFVVKYYINLSLWKLRTRNWSHHMPTKQSTSFVASKDTVYGTQRRALVRKSMKNALYCMYNGMAKGTSRAKATSNRKKIKP